MRAVNLVVIASAIIILNSCGQKEPSAPAFESEYAKGTFGYDLDFLRQSDSVVVLNSKDGNGQIIVSPKYQGKVFTSTADGKKREKFWLDQL